MLILSRAASFLQTLLGRRRLERELDEELHGCLDVLVSRYQRDGLTAEQARRRASLELGGIEQIKEDVRGGRIGNGLVTALRDVRFAVRVLTRDRRFATMAVLVLGLGLGVNTTLFTILNAICLRGLPIAEVGRVFYISTVNQAQERGVSFPELREIRAAANTVRVRCRVPERATRHRGERSPSRTGPGHLRLGAIVRPAARRGRARADADH